MFKAFKEGTSDTFGKFLDAYDKYIAPVLNNIARKFDEVYEQHIGPAMSKIAGAFGPVIDVITSLYQKILKPFVDWCIENIIPVLAPIFEKFAENVIDALGRVADVIGDVAEIIGGFAKVIDGLLNKDFSKVWEGLGDVAGGVHDLAIDVLFKGKKDPSFTDAKKDYDSIKSETATKTSRAEKGSLWDSLRSAWNDWKSGSIVKTAKGLYHKTFTSAKNVWNKWKSSTIVKTVKGKVNRTFDNVRSRWNAWKSGSITKTVKGIAGSGFNTLKNAWDRLKDKTITIRASVTGAIDNIKQLINNRIISPINRYVIGTLNKIPKVNISNIPYLAQGGFVKKNTPQLAVIGDNRHQGEVVAPENKLEQMALRAAQMAGGTGGSAELIALVKEIIMLLKTLNIVVIDDEALRKYFIKKTNANTETRGWCELKI